MLRRCAATCVWLAIASVAAAATIEEIRISGNRRIERSTILYYVHSRVGDEYDEQKLKEDFHRIFETGFFSDVKLDREDGATGTIVTFRVKERPVLRTIDYRGNKAVATSAIQEELKKQKIELAPNTVYSPASAAAAKRAIDKLMHDKGLQFATVTFDAAPAGPDEAALVFQINEGPKARIEEIDFAGNETIGEGALRRAMQSQKEHWFLSFLTSKDLYSKEKFDEDLDRVRMRYWEHGRLSVKVGEPTIRVEDFKTFLLRRDGKKLFFRVPVTEGPEYRTGSVTIEGNSVFPTERLMRFVQLGRGDLYDIGKRNKSLQEIRNLYAEHGYFFAQPGTRDDLNEETKTVDLKIQIEENELCYLNHVEFSGNTTTKDKVLRRELLLEEGDVFDTKRFEDSLKRIQQLGLVELAEEPAIEPDGDSRNRLNVTVSVKEAKRSQVNFGVSSSQTEGVFGSIGYSTSNLLGGGEEFDVELQRGARMQNAKLAVTEPYFKDRPIALGFSLAKSETTSRLLDYREALTGGTLSVGFPIGRTFWRNTTIFGLEAVRYSDIPDRLKNDPYYAQRLTDGTESSVTHILYRSTLDNPVDPHSGDKLSLVQKVAGGWLGGDFDYYRPELEMIHYQPVTRRTSLGLRFQLGYSQALGGKPLPLRGLIYLGGDQSVRGFPNQGVGPHDDQGNVLGGNKSLLLNAEYYIPIAGPAKAVLFFDAGNVWGSDDAYDLFDLRTSTGVEGRITIPAFRVPIRLIAAYNPNPYGAIGKQPATKRFVFTFSIGTTF